MALRLQSLHWLWVLALVAGCEREDPAAAADAVSGVLPATESSRDFGDYVLHFNALATDQLTADVARQYGIVRSRNRALLSVSVLQKQDGQDGPGTPVRGSVSASAINLNGQFRTLTLREISEGAAVYYIGEVPVSHGETLIFTVDATPMNETSRFSVRFMKQFYGD
jgi:hypothetical protein